MGVNSYDRDDIKIKGVDSGGVDQEIRAVPNGSEHDLGVTLGDENVNVFDRSDYIITPFNRLRVSLPNVIFSYKFRTGTPSPVLWDDEITGSGSGGSHAGDDGTSWGLGTTTASGDKYIIATRQYIPYTPGNAQLCTITGNFNGNQANVNKCIGIYDTDDGCFFNENGTNMGVVVRSSTSGSPVDTRITQANWNVDTLDGNGPSGLTADWENQQIFIIDYQWLGSGVVRFGIQIGDDILICHVERYSNTITIPYSKTGDLPVRAEIENTGVPSSSGEMHLTCVSIATDGAPFTAPKSVLSITSGTTETSVTSSFSHLASIRMDPTNNRASLIQRSFSILMTSGTRFLDFRIVHNATLGTPTWTAAGAFSQYMIGTDASSVTGGTEIYAGHINVSGATSVSDLQSLLGEFRLGRSISGTSDTISLKVRTSEGLAKCVFNGQFEEFL